MATRKKLKQRNHIAMDLRTPKYRKRVIRDRTKYDRKVKHRGSLRVDLGGRMLVAKI